MLKLNRIFKIELTVLAVIFLIAFLFNCSGSKRSATVSGTALSAEDAMVFAEPMQSLGTIKKGESKTLIYDFTNTGKEDVVIELATGCQCSEIKAPLNRIFKKGESGSIEVTFHSDLEKDLGFQTKTVDILLFNLNPKNGYQIVKEVKYTLTLEE